MVAVGEGWVWFAAEHRGRYLLITDNGTLGEIVEAFGGLDPGDEKLFGERVLAFESEAERDRFLEEQTSPRSRELAARHEQRVRVRERDEPEH